MRATHSVCNDPYGAKLILFLTGRQWKIMITEKVSSWLLFGKIYVNGGDLIN